MTTQEKLEDIIEDELHTLAALSGEALSIDNQAHRGRIAKFLAHTLLDYGRSPRAGRRVSDRVKEYLLDIQHWLKGRVR